MKPQIRNPEERKTCDRYTERGEKSRQTFDRWAGLCGESGCEPAWGHLSLSHKELILALSPSSFPPSLPLYNPPSHHLAAATTCFSLCMAWLCGCMVDTFNNAVCMSIRLYNHCGYSHASQLTPLFILKSNVSQCHRHDSTCVVYQSVAWRWMTAAPLVCVCVCVCVCKLSI